MHFYFAHNYYTNAQKIDFVKFNFLRGVGGIVVNMDF